jgi:hypothetical protein
MTHPLTKCLITIIVTISTGIIGCAHAADKGAFTVRSEYKQASGDRWKQTVEWEFRPTDANRYQVFRFGDSAVQMILTYDADGRLTLVEDHMSPANSRAIDPNQKLVLSWGYPIPYDNLNPTDDFNGTVNLTKTVDQTRFAYAVYREIRSVTGNDAVSAGMIDADQVPMAADAEFTLITVSYQNSLLVRQLWAEGDSWWLYEETESRRSWRRSTPTQD